MVNTSGVSGMAGDVGPASTPSSAPTIQLSTTATAGLQCSSWSMRTTAGSLSPVCRMCSLCCLPKGLWVWWLCKNHRGLRSESFFQSESSRCVPQMVKNRSRCAAFRYAARSEKKHFSLQKMVGFAWAVIQGSSVLKRLLLPCWDHVPRSAMA